MTTEDFWADRASQQVIRAAGSRKFNPLLHPRGPDGRFIKKNGWVRWMEKGKWRTGVVTHISPTDGSVTVKVAVKNPASLPKGSDPESAFQKDGKTVQKVFAEPGRFLYASEAPKGAPDAKASLAETLPSPTSKEEKGWVKKGGQGGSNLGGKFATPEGDGEVYVKELATGRVQEEVAAAKLYELAGVPVPKLHQKSVSGGGTFGGTSRIGSEIVPGKLTSVKDHLNDPEVMGKVRSGFVLDAWLANWDVIGLDYDNIVVDADGVPWRIDVGGSLRYRAMGSPKGSAFGPEVGELDTMRTKNSKGKVVYAGLTDEELRDGAERLAAISPVDVSRILDEAGLTGASKKELLDTLLARRADILAKTGVEDPYKDVTVDDEGVFSSILPDGAVPTTVGKASSDAIDKALEADAATPGLLLSDGMDVSVGDFVHHLTKGSMAQVTALLPNMGKHGSVEVVDENGKKWRWAVGKLVGDSQQSLDEAYADTPLADGTLPKIGMRVTSSGKNPVTGKVVSIDRKRRWITIAPDDGSANKVRTASTTSPAGEAEIPVPEPEPEPEVPDFVPTPPLKSYATSDTYTIRRAADSLAKYGPVLEAQGLAEKYPEVMAKINAAVADMQASYDGKDYYSSPPPEKVDAVAEALKELIEREAKTRGYDEDIWAAGFDKNTGKFDRNSRESDTSVAAIALAMQTHVGLYRITDAEGTNKGYGLLPESIDPKRYVGVSTRSQAIGYGSAHPDLKAQLSNLLHNPETLTPELLGHIEDIVPPISDVGSIKIPWMGAGAIAASKLSKYEADLILPKIKSIADRWPDGVPKIQQGYYAHDTDPYDLDDPKLADLRAEIDEVSVLLNAIRADHSSLSSSTSFPGAALVLEYHRTVAASPNLSPAMKMFLSKIGRSGGVNKSEMGKIMKILQSPKATGEIGIDVLPPSVVDRAAPSVGSLRFVDKVWIAAKGGRKSLEDEVSAKVADTATPTLISEKAGLSGAYAGLLVEKVKRLGAKSLSDTELATLYSIIRGKESDSPIPGSQKEPIDAVLANIDWDEVTKGPKSVVSHRFNTIQSELKRIFGTQYVALANGEYANLASMEVYAANGDRLKGLYSYYSQADAQSFASLKELLTYISKNTAPPPTITMPPSQITDDPITQNTFNHLIWIYTSFSPSWIGDHGEHAEKLLNGKLTETEARKILDAVHGDMISGKKKALIQIDPFTKQLAVSKQWQAASSQSNTIFPNSLLDKIGEDIEALQKKKAAAASGVTVPDAVVPEKVVLDTDGVRESMSAKGTFDGAPDTTVGTGIAASIAGDTTTITRVTFDSDAIDQHEIVIMRGEDQHGKPYVRAAFQLTGAAHSKFSAENGQVGKTVVKDTTDPLDKEIKELEMAKLGLSEGGSYSTKTAPLLSEVSESNPGYVAVGLTSSGQLTLTPAMGNAMANPPNAAAIGVVDTPDGKKVRVLHKDADGVESEYLIDYPSSGDSGYTYTWIGKTKKAQMQNAMNYGYGSSGGDVVQLTEAAKGRGWIQTEDSVGTYAKRGKDGKLVIHDTVQRSYDSSTVSHSGGVTTRTVQHRDTESGTRIDAFLSQNPYGEKIEDSGKTVTSTHVGINIPIPENMTPEEQEEFIARELSKGLQRLGIEKEKHRAPTVADLRSLAVRSLYRTFVNQTGSKTKADANEEVMLVNATSAITSQFAHVAPPGWKFELERDVVLYKKPDGTVEPRWSPEMTEMLVRLTKTETMSAYSGKSDADTVIERLHQLLNPQTGHGGFMSSSERLKHGLLNGGQSTNADMNDRHAGEGHYFTRRTTGDTTFNTDYDQSRGMVTYIRPSAIFSQLSIWGNASDSFGVRRGHALDVAYGTGSGTSGGYEILTKSSQTADDIAFIIVGQHVMDEIRQRGITHIHGRPVEEIIVSREDTVAVDALKKKIKDGKKVTTSYNSLGEDEVIRLPFGPATNPDSGVAHATEYKDAPRLQKVSEKVGEQVGEQSAEPGSTSGTTFGKPTGTYGPYKAEEHIESTMDLGDVPLQTIIAVNSGGQAAQHYKKVGDSKWIPVDSETGSPTPAGGISFTDDEFSAFSVEQAGKTEYMNMKWVEFGAVADTGTGTNPGLSGTKTTIPEATSSSYENFVSDTLVESTDDLESAPIGTVVKIVPGLGKAAYSIVHYKKVSDTEWHHFDPDSGDMNPDAKYTGSQFSYFIGQQAADTGAVLRWWGFPDTESKPPLVPAAASTPKPSVPTAPGTEKYDLLIDGDKIPSMTKEQIDAAPAGTVAYLVGPQQKNIEAVGVKIIKKDAAIWMLESDPNGDGVPVSSLYSILSNNVGLTVKPESPIPATKPPESEMITTSAWSLLPDAGSPKTFPWDPSTADSLGALLSINHSVLKDRVMDAVEHATSGPARYKVLFGNDGSGVLDFEEEDVAKAISALEVDATETEWLWEQFLTKRKEWIQYYASQYDSDPDWMLPMHKSIVSTAVNYFTTKSSSSVFAVADGYVKMLLDGLSDPEKKRTLASKILSEYMQSKGIL